MTNPEVVINLKNLLYNYKELSKLVSNNVIVVVKANAYGHGAKEVSKYLESKVNNIEAFAVAKVSEAIELRKANVKLKIIVLSELITSDNIEIFNKFNLIPVVFEKKSLMIVQEFKLAYILKFDTGMNRLGFKEKDISYIVTLVENFKPLFIMTHLSVAEYDKKFTSVQVKKLIKFVTKLGLQNIPLSFSNSSGVLNGFTNNIPRIGISIYGIKQVNMETLMLKPTISLISRIISLKKVKKGEYVSYGNTLIEKDSNLAIVSIGYADGYNRSLSNTKTFALTKHGRISLIGKVCMDMAIFDIGDFDLKIGDEVLLYGENKYGQIDIQELSVNANTIPYEFFTNRTKRFQVRYIK